MFLQKYKDTKVLNVCQILQKNVHIIFLSGMSGGLKADLDNYLNNGTDQTPIIFVVVPLILSFGFGIFGTLVSQRYACWGTITQFGKLSLVNSTLMSFFLVRMTRLYDVGIFNQDY